MPNLFHYFSSFWPADVCQQKQVNVESGTVFRIFDFACPSLADLPRQNLYLRDFHQQFILGSSATYDCKAGYVLPSGVNRTAFVLY